MPDALLTARGVEAGYGNRQILFEVLPCPGEDLAEAIAFRRHRPWDELSLATAAVRRHDKAPGRRTIFRGSQRARRELRT